MTSCLTAAKLRAFPPLAMKAPTPMTTLNRLRTTLCCLALVASIAPLTRAGKGLSLSVIQRDGYAEVPIRQPEPNLLLIHAKINGHPVRLILDTGDLFD